MVASPETCPERHNLLNETCCLGDWTQVHGP